MVRPFREVGTSIGITQMTVLCIRYKPRLTCLEEILVPLRCHHCLALLLKENAKIGSLCIVHTLIVNLRQGIQFLTQCFILSFQTTIFYLRKCCQIYILRMECKNGDTTVWIGVGPGVGDGGVIDGKHLQQTLTCLCRPVNHLLQITEVAYSKAIFRTQGEYRYKCSGNLLIMIGIKRLVELITDQFTCLHLRDKHRPVEPCLPISLPVITHGNELEFHVLSHERPGIDIHKPFIDRPFCHRNSLG